MDTPSSDLENIYNKHIAYLKKTGPFELNCSCEIFNSDQINLIKKYGHWFKALTDGILEPFTNEQRHFIKCFSEDSEPFTIEQKAWWLYLKRCEYERKHGERLKTRYSIDDDEFFSREDYWKTRTKR